jgi:hypothetical protein
MKSHLLFLGQPDLGCPSRLANIPSGNAVRSIEFQQRVREKPAESSRYSNGNVQVREPSSLLFRCVECSLFLLAYEKTAKDMLPVTYVKVMARAGYMPDSKIPIRSLDT